MKEAKHISTSNIIPGMIGHYRQLLSLRHEKTDWLRDYSGFGDQLRVLRQAISLSSGLIKPIKKEAWPIYRWDRLEHMHGCEAMDKRFERISTQTHVDIPTDRWGNVIHEYDKAYKL